MSNFKRKVNIVESTTPPTNLYDWWYDLNTNQLKRFQGNAWTKVESKESLDVEAIYDTTYEHLKEIYNSKRMIPGVRYKVDYLRIPFISDGFVEFVNSLFYIDEKGNLKMENILQDSNYVSSSPDPFIADFKFDNLLLSSSLGVLEVRKNAYLFFYPDLEDDSWESLLKALSDAGFRFTYNDKDRDFGIIVYDTYCWEDDNFSLVLYNKMTDTLVEIMGVESSDFDVRTSSLGQYAQVLETVFEFIPSIYNVQYLSSSDMAVIGGVMGERYTESRFHSVFVEYATEESGKTITVLPSILDAALDDYIDLSQEEANILCQGLIERTSLHDLYIPDLMEQANQLNDGLYIHLFKGNLLTTSQVV